MNTYHKINTIFKREQFKNNALIIGDWSEPEFEFLQNNEWEFTEKVDGTNIRIQFNTDGNITIAGKTDRADIPKFLYEKLASIFLTSKFQESMKASFSTMGDGSYPEVCLYGEGYGSKIQKEGYLYNRPDTDFVLFDIKVGEWWLQRNDVEAIARFLSIPIVPVVGRGSLHDAITLVRDGMKSAWGNFTSEGVIAYPVVPLRKRNGERIITKIKTRDFKL